MILFLDFDGVLHPFPLTEGCDRFCATSHLRDLLHQFPEMLVVITSTWRERFSLPQLVELLRSHGGDDLASRIIGVTPVLESDSEYVPGIRQLEIDAWRRSSGHVRTPYLILDDIEEYFDANCPNLYLVDGSTGLTVHDIARISSSINLYFRVNPTF